MTDNGKKSIEEFEGFVDAHNTKMCVRENAEKYGDRSWFKEWCNMK